MRKTNNAYPTFSLSRLSSYDVIRNRKFDNHMLARLSGWFSLAVRSPLNSLMEYSPKDFYKQLLKVLKGLKMANCQEHTDLSATVLGINDIPVKRAAICIKHKYSDDIYNHALNIIPLKENAFTSQNFAETPMQKLKDVLIYDSYFGFVDYPAKAVERYKGECLKFVEGQIAKMCYRDEAFEKEFLDKDLHLNINIPQSPEMDKETKEILKAEHPELIFKKIFD